MQHRTSNSRFDLRLYGFWGSAQCSPAQPSPGSSEGRLETAALGLGFARRKAGRGGIWGERSPPGKRKQWDRRAQGCQIIAFHCFRRVLGAVLPRGSISPSPHRYLSCAQPLAPNEVREEEGALKLPGGSNTLIQQLGKLAPGPDQ